MHAPASPDLRPLLDEILTEAVRRRVSDIHIEPTESGYEVRYRIDGLLGQAWTLDTASGRGAVARLMVLGQLLTYRLDVPQEGRIEWAMPSSEQKLAMRLAVMPTTHGVRAAVRLPAGLIQPQTLEELGFAPRVLEGLRTFAASDAGMLIVTGPAGSGKTTTIYALLRQIVRQSPGLCVITLEDPVERDIPGVTQIEVKPFGQLTYEKCLRSILRQDPQVLMLGEIRDGATASLAVQAALSGHRLVCTLHAASPAGAIQRLLEMGIEPYQITSSLHGVVSQRLLRRKTPDGYSGRIAAAEFVPLDSPLRKQILVGGDESATPGCDRKARGYETLRDAGRSLVEQGVTDDAELVRVLGECNSLF